MLGDPSIDAVFVVTRHSSHAELTRRALLAGKAVFVEKPLALDEDELADVLAAVEESGNDRLQVGFNRRFAPLLHEARQRLGRRTQPATVRYLVNAGPLEHGSWYRRHDTEGSRFAGEGGHFVDTVELAARCRPGLGVRLSPPPATATCRSACATPTAPPPRSPTPPPARPASPRRRWTCSRTARCCGSTTSSKVSVVRGRKQWVSSRLPQGQDKGQRAELDAFLKAVRTGGPMPVPLESLAATTRGHPRRARPAWPPAPVPVPLAGARSRRLMEPGLVPAPAVPDGTAGGRRPGRRRGPGPALARGSTRPVPPLP